MARDYKFPTRLKGHVPHPPNPTYRAGLDAQDETNSKTDLRKALATQALSQEDSTEIPLDRIENGNAFALFPCENFPNGIFLQVNLMSEHSCDFCGSLKGTWLLYYFPAGRYIYLCMEHVRRSLRDHELSFQVSGEITAKAPN